MICICRWWQIESVAFNLLVSFKLYRAKPGHAEQLSDLAFRSKAYWGYSEAFMAACLEELSYTEDEIRHSNCYIAEDQQQIVGFYILIEQSERIAELDALFVEPSAIKQGYGRRLIEHAISIAKNLSVKKIIIQGDPNAENFYLSMGAKAIGTRPSGSIQGRDLPLFEIII